MQCRVSSLSLCRRELLEGSSGAAVSRRVMETASTHVLKRESEFLREGVQGYKNLITELGERKKEGSNISEKNALIVDDIQDSRAALLERLRAAKEKKRTLISSRTETELKIYDTKRCLGLVENHLNSHFHAQAALHDELESVQAHLDNQSFLLSKFMKLNPVNDAFHIWYSGPFATINNFRLGRLPTHQLDWTETNAALGDAAAAVYTIAKIGRINFKRYKIHPMGSFARISKVDDSRTMYNLFTDGSFSLFPKRNFNTALAGFLCCIDEIGEHVLLHDPTLQLPYKIDSVEGKINNHSISVSSTDEEQWTKALKYMLSDIKWIIAWSTKHLQQIK